MDDTQLYFIALVLPEEGNRRVTEVKEHFQDHYGSKAALRSPPHITLHMPFRWPEKKIDQLHEVLSAFAGEHKPMSLTLENYQAFVPRVIYVNVLPDAELSQLHKDLLATAQRELHLYNANYKDQPFVPHVTVAFRDLKKAAFRQAWKIFQSKKFDYQFLAREISLLQHTGKFWEVARKYPFVSRN